MRDDFVDYGILGPLVLTRQGREVEVRAPRQRMLLLSLLLERNTVVSMDRLIEAVWDDSSPATARKTLQLYVSKLRRALGDGALETLPAGYLLRVAPGTVDVDRFEALLADGR